MEREPQSAYSRLKAGGLLDAVQGQVAEANLYRFCQLLEQALPGHPALGSTAHPADDAVRFRPDPGMGFPAAELKSIETDEAYPQRPATVRTRLLGLYGVDSPLPTVFLDDIAQRREGHDALEAFLDIFNHRIFTQFYRIWRKYSYPATFEAGGSDATSQCLLGLIGLGIPGTGQQVATPVSRFLALLSVMRLPTRNAEGIAALVKLLAPNTQAQVIAHWPQNIALEHPASLSRQRPVSLSQGTPLGSVGFDASSQLRLTLHTEDTNEARGWLPGGELHSDLLVLLRVYLGWRCTAKLQLSLPVHSLPVPVLGQSAIQLGMTGVLGLGNDAWQAAEHDTLTINLGRYQGLSINPFNRETQHVAYRFSLVISVALSGCGLAQTVADGTASTAKSIFYKQVKTLHLDFSARTALNTDATDMSALSVPTLVRVYQLRDSKAVEQATYDDLLSDDDQVLATALLDKRTVVVKPEGGAQLNVPMAKDAQSVTVVALFRSPDTQLNTWRLTLTRDDLDPDFARIIELGDNRLTLRPLAKD